MSIGHLIGSYWSWVGGNVGAMPLEAVIGALAALVFGLAFRKPLARLARWAHDAFHRETHAALADLQREIAAVKAAAEHGKRSAAAAAQISADTHYALTGLQHPDSPKEAP